MQKLEEVKGIGPATYKKLNKLGIYTVKDLITYYPFRFNYIEKSNLAEKNQDDNVVVVGIVQTLPNIFYFRKKMNRMLFKVESDKYLLNVTIFNRAFLKDKLKIGESIIIIGKYDKKHSSIVASDVRFGNLTSPKIEPLYHTINGLTSTQIHNYINLVMNNLDYIDYIPLKYIQKYHLLDKKTSILEIHNPSSKKILTPAIARTKYEELFLFMLKMNVLKQNKIYKNGFAKEFNQDKIDLFIQNLPFKLTEDQLKCVCDISIDLKSNKRMNRLVQGDVGSGKTVVAFIATYMNFLAGFQSALMAPTEILATQHYIKARELFDGIFEVALLTGKMKASEKKEIYKKLENGDIDFIIGTHALFTEDVKYKNLGLIVTDEQHRFGVNQRSSLRNKGIYPDILYMSATPIPRTYALTLYGDMDVSSIKIVPSGRKSVITEIKSEDNIREVLEKMYTELKKGHQIYVVAPLIEDSFEQTSFNVESLSEQMKKAFGKLYNVDILHGKMKPNEKEEVMNKFKNNDVQILISTTVIEVGVDVANATMIVIFDSFRFGLSALHQLRGRVGRSSLQSYCILVSNKETKRLEILTKTNDGFKISEEDFKLRGSGDLFGERQSGDMAFKMANIKNDFNILVRAKEDSEEFLKELNKTKEKNIWQDYLLNTMNLD